MDVVEFRGKSKKNGIWLYGYLGESKIKIFNTEYFEKVIFDNIWRFNTDNCSFVVEDIAVYPSTIGIYTGLKDKNGKKIFEGDIIQWSYIYGQERTLKGIIKWYNDMACFAIYKSKEDKYPYEMDLMKVIRNGIEVIGNIHDNPELENIL